MKHHSEDYKLSAVKYYLKHNQDMRNTCKIFDCKYQSLARWVKTYKKQGLYCHVIGTNQSFSELNISRLVSLFIVSWSG